MENSKIIRERLRASHPERVNIRLAADRGKPDSLLVSVNGARYAIKRGVSVEVPWIVAQVIAQSERSDAALEKRIARLTEHPAVSVL